MFLTKKWGILIKKESESLDFRGLKIPRDYLIHLEDNGRGMTEKEIQEKNELLKKNVYEKQSSIGLSNVNRRVKAVYGPEYGVYIKQSQSGGVCVTLEIRYEEGTINENSDAGGR